MFLGGEQGRLLVFGCDLAREQRTSFELELTLAGNLEVRSMASGLPFECSLYGSTKLASDGRLRAVEARTHAVWLYGSDTPLLWQPAPFAF